MPGHSHKTILANEINLLLGVSPSLCLLLKTMKKNAYVTMFETLSQSKKTEDLFNKHKTELELLKIPVKMSCFYPIHS